jgi:integrase
MSITKEGGRFRFQFKRIIAGRRVRASKLLPKGWTAKQADEYDRKETARLYAAATGQKDDPLIDDAVLHYLQERCPKLKTGDEIERQLAADLHIYTGKRFSELPEIARTIRQDNQSEATKRIRIAYLRAACRYAYKHHGMGEYDPAGRVAMPQVNNERQIYATREDMLAIARNCRRSTRPFIRLAFYSGMRLGEILRVRIKDNRFYLADTKNGTPRIIPIHPKIRTALRHLPPKVAKSTIQDHFREAREAAKLDHVRFHDLRHSAASEMINLGVDLYTVGAVLGHKDSRSTKRYAHLAVQTLEEAVKKIGRKRPNNAKEKKVANS